jgi:hypothetical protein
MSDTKTPIMDESDVERMLRERIETQARMISVALGYIHAGQPELAAKVLEGAKI